jgi:acetyl-CoA synthetase
VADPALIWEHDDPKTPSPLISYSKLREQTSRMANVLKSHGVARFVRVLIYLPIFPDAAYAMLACAREYPKLCV